MSQRGGEGRREWNRGEQRSLTGEGGLYLDICVGAPEFLVTPLLIGPVCLLSQGRFEEPVRLCIVHSFALRQCLPPATYNYNGNYV